VPTFSDLILAIAMALLFVCLIVERPTRARCPEGEGWFVNGIRPNGAYACLRDRDPTATSSAGHDEIDGWIACPPSFMPIVRSERSVGCSTIP